MGQAVLTRNIPNTFSCQCPLIFAESSSPGVVLHLSMKYSPLPRSVFTTGLSKVQYTVNASAKFIQDLGEIIQAKKISMI